MKIFKNLRDWIDSKIIDTILGKAIERWQTLHPASYLAVLAISGTLIAISDQVLEQHAILCAQDLCIQGIEYYTALVTYYASLIVAFLSGTMSFSELREKLKDPDYKKDEE